MKMVRLTDLSDEEIAALHLRDGWERNGGWALHEAED